MSDPAAQEVAEHIRAVHVTKSCIARKNAVTVPPQTEMKVTARSRPVRSELRHERHAQAHLFRHFLQTLLVDHMPVRHLQRLGVAHVQLVLPESPFPLGVFDGHAGVFQMVTHGACVGFGARALQDVIVLQIPAGGLHAAITLLGSRAVAIAEEVVLELGSGKAREAQASRRLNLPAQD